MRHFGIRCGDQDVVRWDSEYGQIEQQANEFSATLLMPLDDFRRLIAPQVKPDLDILSECAERYGVSLIAAVRRWLDYTERRAVLVVSREGFILWARSSGAALRTGAFFRTATNTIPLPERSLAYRQDGAIDGRQGVELPAAVWFPEPVKEMTVFADQYDFAITLLLLGDQMMPRWQQDAAEEWTLSIALWESVDRQLAWRCRWGYGPTECTPSMRASQALMVEARWAKCRRDD